MVFWINRLNITSRLNSKANLIWNLQEPLVTISRFLTSWVFLRDLKEHEEMGCFGAPRNRAPKALALSSLGGNMYVSKRAKIIVIIIAFLQY